MTARTTLYCDGLIGPAQYECRQAVPVGAVLTGKEARVVARRQCWTSEMIARPKEGVIRHRVEDFCPSCTRNRQ